MKQERELFPDAEDDMPFESREPRYLALAKAITRDIRSGTYPVGSLLPPEWDLCERFGVSRSTVREAIRKLSEVGLVIRHHGVGTRVEAAEVEPRYTFSIGAFEDFLHYIAETRLKVLRRDQVPAKLAGVELPEVGDDWLMYEGFRYKDTEANPICWTRVFLHPRYRTVSEQSGRTSEPLFLRIQKQYGVKLAELEQQISAVLLAPEVATLLKAEPSSPALSTLRRYLGSDGGILAVTMSIHPADRFRYDQSLRAEYGSGERR